VQGGHDVLVPEVGFDVLEIGRPVHAAGRIEILETDVVHVITLLLALGVEVGGHLEDVAEDGLAFGVVDSAGVGGYPRFADAPLLLELFGVGAVLFDEVACVGELEV